MTKYEEAIDHYKYGISHDIFAEPVTTYAQLSIEALEKQIPKKPSLVHKTYQKHDWKLDISGEIDTWAWESDFHNGPTCKRCHYSPCEYCDPDYDEGVCEINRSHCPICNKIVFNPTKFCSDCGQALDWSELQ